MSSEEPGDLDTTRVTTRYEEPAGADAPPARPTSRFDDDEAAPVPGVVTERFPDEHVTERFPEARATERFLERRATARMPEEPAARPADTAQAPKSSLALGELVGDRYRVEEGPLWGATGEADVFRCEDTQTGEAVALKFYHQSVAPKEAILKSLLKLHHPGVVTLRDYGTWQGRFYEVMDFCVGGSLMDHMPFDEPTLKLYIQEIADGLHYLHNIGIVHRDIKPNNLMFRQPDRQEVVIGDFGVSSVLESGEKVRKTSTGAFFTLDYAAPELLDGKQVGPKTDFYALGITLLHLYTGQSPFAGMDKNTILGCHFRGKAPRPPHLSKEFTQLLNGLLRVFPEKRWGYAQIVSWLHGELVLTDDGLPDRDEIEVGKKLPYRNSTMITTPREMLNRLDDFDAAKDLQRGFISQWLMYFDVALANQVTQLEEEFSDNPAMGVFKLRYLLDPSQPLEIGSRKVHNVEQLIRVLVSCTDPEQRILQDLLYAGSIAVWISALRTDEETKQLVARIRAITERLRGRLLGLFALLYTLDPTRPMTLGGRAVLRTPEDIESILPEHVYNLTRYLYSGHLREWMIAAFPERVEDIEFITFCMENFGRKDPEHGLFALRCHFHPALPFPIGTRRVDTPKQLAALISTDPVYLNFGTKELARGWIRTWLVYTGQLTDVEPFDAVVNDPESSWPRKMEAVLHILDPGLAWPSVASDCDSLHIDGVTSENMKTTEITFFNAGRGYLSGVVTLESSGAGFEMLTEYIEGAPVTVGLSVSGRGLPLASTQRATVVAETNGGRIEVPVSFQVNPPRSKSLLRTLIAATIAGAGFGLIRLGIQLFLPRLYDLNILDWFGLDEVTADGYSWGLVPVALFLLVQLLAGIYYLYAMDRARDFAQSTQDEEEPR